MKNIKPKNKSTHIDFSSLIRPKRPKIYPLKRQSSSVNQLPSISKRVFDQVKEKVIKSLEMKQKALPTVHDKKRFLRYSRFLRNRKRKLKR